MLFEYELVVLLAMIAVILICNLRLKLPLSVSTVLASVAGTLTAGEGIPLRHLFEGSFALIDMALLITCAMIFMNVVGRAGTFEAVGATIAKRFYRYPALLVVVLMLLLLFPGMITGSANVSVLSVGPIVMPILAVMGMPAAEIGAFLSVGAALSLAAPPVNIPAMLIANNVDMTYKGFAGPLLFITVSSALFAALYLSRKYRKPIALEVLQSGMDLEADRRRGVRHYLPILFVVTVIVAIRAFPQVVPDIGNPLILLMGAAVGCLVGEKINLLDAAKQAVHTSVSIMGKMMAIGMFMQVLSLTGIRGYIVANTSLLPVGLMLAMTCIIMPVFGGVSVYGSSMLLSGAVILSMLTGNQIVIGAALSVLAGLGELMPPAALSANYAAGIVGEKYGPIIRHCAVPLAFIVAVCYLCMYFSGKLAFLTMV